MSQIRRRQFLVAASGLLVAPLYVRAQAPRKRYRISFPAFAPFPQDWKGALEQSLQEQGYVIGRDVLIEYRWGDGRPESLQNIVGEVVRSNPDVIVTGLNIGTAAVKAAAQRIPIVMVIGTDVVASGFAQSLVRPGGNITGLTWDVGGEIVGKRLDLLKELQPKVVRVAVLWEHPYRTNYQVPTDKTSAALRMTTRWFECSGSLESDFAEIERSWTRPWTQEV